MNDLLAILLFEVGSLKVDVFKHRVQDSPESAGTYVVLFVELDSNLSHFFDSGIPFKHHVYLLSLEKFNRLKKQIVVGVL